MIIRPGRSIHLKQILYVRWNSHMTSPTHDFIYRMLIKCYIPPSRVELTQVCRPYTRKNLLQNTSSWRRTRSQTELLCCSNQRKNHQISKVIVVVHSVLTHYAQLFPRISIIVQILPVSQPMSWGYQLEWRNSLRVIAVSQNKLYIFI